MGFAAKPPKRKSILPGEKKNPSAEGFRQVIAERDREIVEIRYKISLPAFFLKKARDLSKLRK